MVGDVWFILGAILIAATPATKNGVIMVFVGRIILGFGVGIASAVAPVYIAEVAPTRFRAALITIQSVAITGGQFISYILGIPLDGHNGWRYLFAIAVVPAIIQGVCIHFLPESPRYDLIIGNNERAKKTLANVYKVDMDSRIVKLKFEQLSGLVSFVQTFRQDHTTMQQFKLIATEGEYFIFCMNHKANPLLMFRIYSQAISDAQH